jgi:hypothetical protein
VNINCRIDISSSIIIRVTYRQHENFWEKNQMVSEWNELSPMENSKGITRKEFWYRTDVSINWGICISPSKIMQGNIT